MLKKCTRQLRNCWDQKGFTLVELIVVVGIILILASVVLIQFQNAKDEAIIARVTADLRTLGNAVEICRTANGNYPGSLSELSPAFIKLIPVSPQGSSYQYPTGTDPSNPNEYYRVSYVYKGKTYYSDGSSQ